MSIIAWIVLGAIAGYLAGFIVKGDEGLGIIGHIVLGIVGAFSSVGTLVIAPVLQALLGVWDWRWGAALFVLLVIGGVARMMSTQRGPTEPQPAE